jgi:hypothetical protein
MTEVTHKAAPAVVTRPTACQQQQFSWPVKEKISQVVINGKTVTSKSRKKN